MYSDYTFYLNDYDGKANEEVYSRFSKLAAAHIDRLTSNRAKTATGAELEAVKMAECAIIDELDRQDRGGVITSESNDGISRSYSASAKTEGQRIYSVASVFLNGTGLMFAGV